MRKMATIRKIDNVRPIEGADAIECAVVGGWTVVIKKGEYQPGDLAVYCEVDSWIPTEIAPFLSKGKEPREFEGVKGERLRTVKLRGQLSQGLLLKPADVMDAKQFTLAGLGGDVSELLNIKKYEPPLPAELAGVAAGLFPSWMPKTDQERIQNLSAELDQWRELEFEVTEKLHGSSMTVFLKDGQAGVCSRNYELRETDSNTLWRVARDQGLIEGLQALGRDLALQGELIGFGLNGNQYKLSKQEFHLFDIYDIAAGRYLNAQERQEIAAQLRIPHVPVVSTEQVGDRSIAELLAAAEGRSQLNGSPREGLVYKCTSDTAVSFKVISNAWLLKNDG